MGKIKDWKKIGKSSWEIVLGYDSIITIEVWKNKRGSYTITKIPTTGSDIHLARRKTKAFAFKYAIRYMKSHPKQKLLKMII